ncbi:MAG: STAS domain-containing protein [Alkalispirochaeta sp.]
MPESRVHVHHEPQTESVAVEIVGELTIDTVAEVQRQFAAALELHRPVTVQVEQVTSFDLSGMQLCLVFRREAEAREISVEFSGDQSRSRFSRMLSFAGLPEL